MAGKRFGIGLKSPPFVLQVRLAIKPRHLFCHSPRVAPKKINFVELKVNGIVVQLLRDCFVQRLPRFIQAIENHEHV
jgi:hypothetical protein